MNRGLVVTKRFVKDYKKIGKIIQKNTDKTVSRLRENIFADEQDIKKIKGYNNIWRVRVGHYRLVYSFDEEDVILLRIMHRKDIYKSNLEEY